MSRSTSFGQMKDLSSFLTNCALTAPHSRSGGARQGGDPSGTSYLHSFQGPGPHTGNLGSPTQKSLQAGILVPSLQVRKWRLTERSHSWCTDRAREPDPEPGLRGRRTHCVDGFGGRLLPAAGSAGAQALLGSVLPWSLHLSLWGKKSGLGTRGSPSPHPRPDPTRGKDGRLS